MRIFPLAAGLVVLALTGCESEPKKPPIPPSADVSFTVPTGKIAVAPLKIQLDQRTGIGVYHRNVDCWVRVRDIMPSDVPHYSQLTNEVQRILKQSKLSVLPGSPETPAAAAGADYLLTGTIPEVHADLCIDNFFNDGPADVDAQVGISWSLISVRDGKEVYHTNTSGTARASDPNQTITAGVVAAIDDATKQLLQTVTVQQYLTFGHVVVPTPQEVAAGSAVPPGGQGPIPVPPPSFIRPAVALSPILVPVHSPRPEGTALDRAAVRAATVPVGTITGKPGAGIALGDGYVLTAASVIGDAVSVVVTLAPGRTAEGRLVRKDAELDLALLKVDGALPPAVPLHPRRVAVGDKVFAVGAGGVVAGTITTTKAASGHDQAKFEGAETGGPVVDANGNVIGLLQAGGNYTSIGSVFRALNMGAQLTDE
jgi:S1-C subfamily serine protease